MADKIRPALLDCVPRRSVEHEDGDDGRLVLLRPKYARGFLARWLQPQLKHKHFHIALDEIGTAVWEAIDGRRNVRQIADLLHDRFGEQLNSHHERCARFIEYLHQSAMVDLYHPTGKEEG